MWVETGLHISREQQKLEECERNYIQKHSELRSMNSLKTLRYLHDVTHITHTSQATLLRL